MSVPFDAPVRDEAAGGRSRCSRMAAAPLSTW